MSGHMGCRRVEGRQRKTSTVSSLARMSNTTSTSPWLSLMDAWGTKGRDGTVIGGAITPVPGAERRPSDTGTPTSKNPARWRPKWPKSFEETGGRGSCSAADLAALRQRVSYSQPWLQLTHTLWGVQRRLSRALRASRFSSNLDACASRSARNSPTWSRAFSRAARPRNGMSPLRDVAKSSPASTGV